MTVTALSAVPSGFLGAAKALPTPPAPMGKAKRVRFNASVLVRLTYSMAEYDRSSVPPSTLTRKDIEELVALKRGSPSPRPVSAPVQTTQPEPQRAAARKTESGVVPLARPSSAPTPSPPIVAPAKSTVQSRSQSQSTRGPVPAQRPASPPRRVGPAQARHPVQAQPQPQVQQALPAAGVPRIKAGRASGRVGIRVVHSHAHAHAAGRLVCPTA